MMNNLKANLIIFSLFIIGFSCNNSNDDKLPFKDFRSGSCFVFLDINYKNEISTIVIENERLFGYLRDRVYNSEFLYYRYLKLKRPLEVNENLYNELSYFKLNKEEAISYEAITDNNILIKDLDSDSLNYENEKAIIYTLLKRQINCCVDDESGYIIMVHPPQ